MGNAEPQDRAEKWIAARTFGVVVALAIVLEPRADHGRIGKMDQHVRTPFRMAGKQSPPHSLGPDLAVKNAERRGCMGSSGMEQWCRNP